MSAKRALALLVIVALSLLLASGSAMSRPDTTPRDVGTAGSGVVTLDDVDGPDVIDPGDGAIGDDDNWDKPAPGVHAPVDRMGEVDGGWLDEDSSGKPLGFSDVLSTIWLRILFPIR